MKYDPKKHLLRPLQEGEIIEDGDMTINGLGLIQSQFQTDVFSNGRFMPHFRPVPIPTWHPLSESHLLKEAPKGSRLMIWTGKKTVYWDIESPILPNDMVSFYIIPPCELPTPDPERERFEEYFKIRYPFGQDPDKKEEFYAIWKAARKEGAV